MKTKIFMILLVAVSAVIIGIAAPQKFGKVKKTEPTSQTLKINQIKSGDGHAKLPVDCYECHNCDLPTKKDPCLKICPRDTMISIEYKAEDAPHVVQMNKNPRSHGKVVFSHLLHAQMSELGNGCDGCHHYNTTGPIVNCKNCHEEDRKRADISRPDLQGAYHRLCLNCHREWSHKSDCEQCHLPLGNEGTEKAKQITNKLAGMSHPKLTPPEKFVYQTKSNKGKIVTFRHGDHANVYGVSCKSCHQKESCTKCHDKQKPNAGFTRKTITAKSFEAQHSNCISCHKNNSCNKCHADSELQKFDHGKVTGFDLKSNHSSLACSKCHIGQKPIAKLNPTCTNCHKNFEQGKFNHAVTGLKLDDNHTDLDCESCHINKNFAKTPQCSDCHDDKSFPKQRPGKLVKINKQ